MTTASDTHELLAEAAYFCKEGDPAGALRRAREAVTTSQDGTVRDEAQRAAERYEAAAGSWRDGIALRQAAHVARELRAVGADEPLLETVRDEPPRARAWGWIARAIRPRSRVVSVAP